MKNNNEIKKLHYIWQWFAAGSELQFQMRRLRRFPKNESVRSLAAPRLRLHSRLFFPSIISLGIRLCFILKGIAASDWNNWMSSRKGRSSPLRLAGHQQWTGPGRIIKIHCLFISEIFFGFEFYLDLGDNVD
ncbi:hypothetical protein NPIL_664941 [Nephila pilipes]|uniref:Uncharacterized protein n=1 Tax=Nephila pilipes TaxID=299642 RepID=A0A8X6QHH9_NEPPI|nr:hypothetical protein NPIL_664941 [Nephila pilipes]